MWKFFIISTVVVVSTSLPTTEIVAPCKIYDNIEVCINSTGAVSVSQIMRPALTLYAESISLIGPGAFKNLSLALLAIVPSNYNDSAAFECIPRVIDVTAESFHGLPFVRSVQLACVQLRGAPNPFKTLNFLENLRFEKNQFTDIPQELCGGLPNLEVLMVKHQQIKSLSPASFSQVSNERLTKLTLESNGLKSIEPQSFARFGNLKTLELAENHLEVLRPDMFDGLHKLQFLELSNNQLREIQPSTFSGLKDLFILDLQNNHLESLPGDVITGLKTLKISGNAIKPVNSESNLNSKNISESIFVYEG